MGVVRLTILMPVYNESATVKEIVRRVQRAELDQVERELLIVDDRSSDDTPQVLATLDGETSIDLEARPFELPIRVFYHDVNQGKGGALQTGIAHSTGDYLIIQDADLEYDPSDYRRLLAPVTEGRAEVVYGSRFAGRQQNMSFTHWLGNRFLTLMTNVLYGVRLSDMETCYKLFPGEWIRAVRIRSSQFDFEPEITAKVLKQGMRIHEVPISYLGREFDEGKKITWRDGFAAVWTLVKYRFVD